MKQHKIAVVGPIPRDHITTDKGQVIEKYGAVTHPAIALCKLLAEHGTVIPVAHVHQADEANIRAILSEYPNMSLDGLSAEQDRGAVIELKFVDQNNRLEKQTAFMAPITPDDIAPALDADVFVFVPITDHEVPLLTLKHIKEKGKPDAVTILDAHGSTTVVTTQGMRERRFWTDRDMWLPYIDVLKMNIEEAGCCWFANEYKSEDLQQKYTELSDEDMAAFAKHCLERGVKAVYITLDARGCMLYTMPGGEFRADFISSVPVEYVVDTTGCGDSFAGGLAFGLVDDREAYIRAAQFANALGALRTQGTTFEVFKSKAETEDIIRYHYGETAAV